ncbi:serine O-acetyltransferase [Pedobacter sp. WC2501]|uniref:serine O-acetyltransferase n=1 Tax=Pedobacter sp. WC2501 TaxID=3461400 RepID=UPI004046004C
MNEMIKDRNDLNNWLTLDMEHYKPSFSDRILVRQNALIARYLIHLRKAEYYANHTIGSKIKRILKAYHTYQMRRLSYKLGFQIGLNTCGPGLIFYHFGHIIINNKAKIGEGACIYPGVVVGQDEQGGTPKIGKNCFLGLGSKVFGPITIGDNVTILANSVVLSDVPDNWIVGGIPAKLIKERELPLNFKNKNLI